MYKPSLRFVVTILALLYLLAGAASTMAMREREEFIIGWALLAGFWFFLTVSIWRLSRIARTVSVTLLWTLVLIGALGALHPYYFPELKPAFAHPGLQNQPEILLVPAFLSLWALRILARNKQEFR